MTQYDNTCDAPAVPQSSSSSSAGTTISPVTTPITLTPVTTTPVTPITPSSSTPAVVLSTNATSRDVYNWAFTNHITTLPLAKARLYDSIQRYEAAKMIVQFVTNVEKKTIAHNPTCNVSTYIDYNTFDAEMKTNIQSICDLGLMGWKGDKSSLLSSFRPFDTLSAEEFGIVIGRYL